MTLFDDETIRITARADSRISWMSSELVVGKPSNLEFEVGEIV